MRVIVLLAAWSCSPAEPAPDTQTDDPVDTSPPPGCDFSAFAGDWEGQVTWSGGAPNAMVLTLASKAAIDEAVGVADYPPDFCTVEFRCTGRRQNNWDVTIEHVTERLDLCVDGYAFFRPESDGTLTYEGAYTEFGERAGHASLSRAP